MQHDATLCASFGKMMVLTYPLLFFFAALAIEVATIVFFSTKGWLLIYRTLGNRPFAKVSIAIQLYVYKHVFRLWYKGEDRYVFQYDKIRDISVAVSLFVFCNIVIVLYLILAALAISTPSLNDDLLVHVSSVLLIFVLFGLFQYIQRVTKRLEAQLAFLDVIERARSTRHGQGFKQSVEGGLVEEGRDEDVVRVLQELDSCARSDKLSDKQKYAELLRLYAEKRLASGREIDDIVKRADATFKRIWTGTTVQPKN